MFYPNSIMSLAGESSDLSSAESRAAFFKVLAVNQVVVEPPFCHALLTFLTIDLLRHATVSLLVNSQ